MIGSIPRRGCAVLLTVLVSALVGLVGAPPAAADATIDELGEAVLYFTAADGLTRVGAYGSPSETFTVAEPTGVALDDDGSVYVTSKLGSDPVVREFKADEKWSDPLLPGLSSADDVAVREGRLVVADSAGEALKVSGDGPTTIPTPNRHPTKVANTADALYFVDGENGGVYRYTTANDATTVLTDALTSSLAADADGNLYLGQSTKIVKYDAESHATTDFVTGLESAPIDLAVSESGDLYFATSDGAIKRKSGSDWWPGLSTVATGVDGLTAIAVRTVPARPGAISAEGGDEKATVYWSPSETNGGSDQIRYEVSTYVGDEIGEPIPADVPVCATRATHCTISNLKNGERYTFEVTAFNTPEGNDTGSSSAYDSNWVYAGVGPAAPVIGTATPGNEAASVTFAAGADNDLSTTAWIISVDRLEWRPAEVMQTSPEEFEVVFRGLVND
jgi:hypothetical protein